MPIIRKLQIAPLVQLFAGKLAPLWAYIDLEEVDPIPLLSLLWLLAQFCPKPLNPVLAHILVVWDSVKYSAGLISLHLPLLGVFNCPLFPRGLDNPHSFKWWHSKGLTTVHYLLTCQSVYTFQQLKEIYDVPDSEKYCYIQIHHFLNSFFHTGIMIAPRMQSHSKPGAEPIRSPKAWFLYCIHFFQALPMSRPIPIACARK